MNIGAGYYFPPFVLALALFFTVWQAMTLKIKRHKIEREIGDCIFYCGQHRSRRSLEGRDELLRDDSVTELQMPKVKSISRHNLTDKDGHG